MSMYLLCRSYSLSTHCLLTIYSLSTYYVQSMEEYSHLLECWRLMDLSRVPGFPIWLSEVFHELQARAS